METQQQNEKVAVPSFDQERMNGSRAIRFSPVITYADNLYQAKGSSLRRREVNKTLDKIRFHFENVLIFLFRRAN